MRDEDPRPLAQTLGSAAAGIGIGLAILALGFVVSRVALPEPIVAAETFAAPATSAPPRTTAPVAPTLPPTSSPRATAAPVATPDPMTVAAYQGQGLRLAAITIPGGYTFTSPIAGKVSIALYQWADGQIKTGLTDQPSYPYIFIRSADREVKLRPGAIDRDIKLLVQDGDTIAAGAPLFTTLNSGASSWATFYDGKLSAQVVASAIALPAGTEIDPVALFKR